MPRERFQFRISSLFLLVFATACAATAWHYEYIRYMLLATFGIVLLLLAMVCLMTLPFIVIEQLVNAVRRWRSRHDQGE